MKIEGVDLERVRDEWQTQGFLVLRGHLSSEMLGAAVEDLGRVFPSAEGFHEGTDQRRSRFIGDEFAGIDLFPFPSVELSMLAVSDPVVRLARALLRDDDVRLYSAETWAKFTGAADYDQLLLGTT